MANRLRRLLFGAPHIAPVAPHPDSLGRCRGLLGGSGPARWSIAEVLEAGWLSARRPTVAPGAQDTQAVLVLVTGPEHDARPQLAFARSLSGDVRAVHVDENPDRTRSLLAAWARSRAGVPLLVLQGGGLRAASSLRAYVELLTRDRAAGEVSLVLPACESGPCRAKITCVLRGMAARLVLAGVPGVRVYGGGLAPACSERELVGCAAEA